MDSEILSFVFMQRAFIAALFVGVSCGIVGVFVVILGLSSVGVCVSHAALAGALFAVLFDLNRLFWVFVFSIFTVAIIGPIARRGKLKPDAAIGVLFSLSLGISFLFLALIPGPKTEALSFFWGNILTLSNTDVVSLAVVAALVCLFLLLFFKEIKAVLCHREIATAVGIPATLIFFGMLILTGASISAALPSVGGLLIYSLITAPAAAAYQLSFKLKYVFLISVLIGVCACWMGLFLSYIFDLPSGAVIVLFASLIFAVVVFFFPKDRRGTN